MDSIRANYLVEDLKRDAQQAHNFQFVKSVHVQAACTNPVGETKMLQELADKYGFPHGIVAYANLTSPHLDATLAAHKSYRNIRGIRHFNLADPTLLYNEKYVKGIGELEKYNFSFDFQMWHHQLKRGAEIVALYPRIQFILNHTGTPEGRSQEIYEEWREGMQALAKHPNVAVKISGLGSFDNAWTIDSIRPYVLSTIEIFGVDRCMFASNFPMDKLFSDYTTLFNAYLDIVKDFSAEDKRKLFHDNAIKYYRLPEKAKL